MKKFFNIIQSKRLALVISILICATLYLSFLTLAFTTTREQGTYICYTVDGDTCFHSPICELIRNKDISINETTVYEASKTHKKCNSCTHNIEAYKTTITVTERNYLIPALISLPISAVIFVALPIKEKE